MYEIVLNTWYQETPDEVMEEVYRSMEFETIEDARQYLGKNVEKIIDEFPIEEIAIRFKQNQHP